jgi:Ca-activated chloride channel family protein
LDINSLQKITEKGGGVLHSITNGDTDLQAVLTQNSNTKNTKNNNKQDRTDDLNSIDWKSTGPFIVLLLLPLAALAFRKGWLFSLCISATLLASISLPKPVLAATNTDDQKVIQNLISQKTESSWTDFFTDLLKNKEQRADSAFQNQQYDKTIELTKNPLTAGSAAYKKGDYKQAFDFFKNAKGADAKYNEGNALAKLEKYQEAIKAYADALKQQPDLADAKQNKSTLEQFLKQKKQQKPEDQKSNNDSNKNSDKKQDQQKNDSQKDADKNKDQQGKPSDKGQKGEQKNTKDKNSQGDKKNQFSDANKEMNKKSDEKADNESNENKDADNPKPEDEPQKISDSKPSSENDKGKKSDEDKNIENIKGTKAEADELNKEEKMAAEQWLRRIPDDPGGLLRRKFKRQYRLRKRPSKNENPW